MIYDLDQGKEAVLETLIGLPYYTSSYSMGQGTRVGALPMAKYVHSNYTLRDNDITTVDAWAR